MDRSNDAALLNIENDTLRFTFDASTASIVRLTLKGGDRPRELIAPGASPQPMFRLHWGAPVQQPAPAQPALRAISIGAQLSLVDLQTESPASIHATYEVHDEGNRATVTVSIRVGHEIHCEAQVANHASSQPIREVFFPVLGNVRVCDDASAEALLYPFYSGVHLAAPRRAILQGRTDSQAAAPLMPTFDPNGGMVRHLYCGQLSMPWMSVTDGSCGVGLIHCDPTYEVSSLAVYAPCPAEDDADAAAAGLDLAVSKLRPVEPGTTRSVPPTVLLPYVGSWHQVADRYRSWTTEQRFLPPRVPDWVRESHALTAHYDFKWEDGTFHHTFADIPKLYRRSAKEGINHLFMAGWFTGGFDHMYPEFFPDLQLGTVMDFIDAVRTVRDEGGKATFYINATLFGRASRYFETLGNAWAAKSPEGKTIDRRFFGRDFVISCRGVQGYRRLMRDTVRWLVGEVGASGVYLDTFAAMGPHLCFDPSHGHPHPAHWNRDSVATLRTVEDAVRSCNQDAFTMVEGCGDLYGQWVVAHLIHGWFYPNTYPAMFRYTFPEYVLVDMVYPSKGQSFRPARISHEAYDQLHRTFIHGCILWVYDQEDERFCNFRTDPQMWAYIKELIELREHGKRYFGYGTFVDTVGIRCSSDEVDVKRFRAAGHTGKFDQADLEMLAVWNRSGSSVTVSLDRSLIPIDPTQLRLEAFGVKGPVPLEYAVGSDAVHIKLTGEQIQLVFIKTNSLPT